MLSPAQIMDIKDEAIQAATDAASELAFKFELEDRFTGCGFAWISIYEYEGKKIKGNTKMGKNMKAAGIKQDYQRTFQIWGPSKYGTQDVTINEAGAQAAAEVFEQYGFKCYAGSRLD